MRKGDNPVRDKLLEKSTAFHRIIIPLHIPSETDEYYKDAFSIFTYCLFSVRTTAVSDVKISVVCNGCAESVHQKVLQLTNENHIDELIIEKEKIGKINSILRALRNAEEDLITITDADVLFCNGWEDAVIELFKQFPKAGAICPVPVFRKHFHLTSNIWLRHLFSNKLRFLPVKNPEAMTRFANSIGWSWLDIKYKDVIGTLQSKNGTIAVLGCSHFVSTYKREVFEKLPKENSKYLLGGDSEFLYTDKPVLQMGAYRLSTYENYAFHMGNVLEDWMTDTFQSIQVVAVKDKFPKLNKIKYNPLLNYSFIENTFKYLLTFKPIKRKLLKLKGLNKEQIVNFTEKT